MSESPVVVTPPAEEPKPTQPPATEAPPPKPAEAPAPDPKALQEQFKKLTARERSFLAEKQKHSEERRSLEAERAKLKAELDEAAQLKKWREGAKIDPESYLKPLFGDDWYDQLTQLKLDKKAPADLRVSAVKDDIEALRKELKDRDEREAASAREREQAAQREAIDTFNRRAVEAVKAAGDKYELLNMWGYHDQVPELVRLHWQDQNAKLQRGEITEAEVKLLSVEAAAQMVEDWCVELATRAQKSKRLTTPAKPAQTAPRSVPEGTPRVVTLSNDMTETSRVREPAKTEAERVARAFAAFDAARAGKK